MLFSCLFIDCQQSPTHNNVVTDMIEANSKTPYVFINKDDKETICALEQLEKVGHGSFIKNCILKTQQEKFTAMGSDMLLLFCYIKIKTESINIFSDTYSFSMDTYRYRNASLDECKQKLDANIDKILDACKANSDKKFTPQFIVDTFSKGDTLPVQIMQSSYENLQQDTFYSYNPSSCVLLGIGLLSLIGYAAHKVFFKQ